MSLSLEKLGDEVIGVKVKRDNGEVTGYLEGSARMLDILKREQ